MAQTPEDRMQTASPAGEEELRFIRNFNDIFLSIGLVIFIAGLGIGSTLVGGEIIPEILSGGVIAHGRKAVWTGAAIAFADAAIIWGLGEVFARTRRLFLPAIVLLIGFLFFFVAAVGAAYLAVFDVERVGDMEQAGREFRRFALVLALAGAGGSFAFYARTKLPFAMGVLGLALAACAVAGLALADPGLLTGRLFQTQLAAGLFLFALGIFFDARDPGRQTRLSDNAFWLHFFAAPLIFFSVMSMTTPPYIKESAAGAAAMTLVIIGVFAVVSLLINRRALLVAGLLSAIGATWTLVEGQGLTEAWTIAATLLLIGGTMVLLGAGWHTVRRVLIAPFPRSGLLARIVPPEPPRA